MITQQPHNPQNLTPEQVGVEDGWRLLFVGENKPLDCEFYPCGQWGAANIASKTPAPINTYRTKQPSPFADGWIKMSERKPQLSDTPLWLYDGNAGSEIFYWMSCNNVPAFAHWPYWMPAKPPAPPVVELTQAQKDEAALDAFALHRHYSDRDLWFAALAYARSEKGSA